ncbi:MAG: deoxyribose-phosphate aldolase [Clostridia bacterium]|nr:deoxyribose-phosphate aldolase [Clostridia bacterium]
MNIVDILSRCDHTLLTPTASERDILSLCDDGLRYGVASVCIPPSWVRVCRGYLGDRLPICTVIGFPNGYSATSVKVAETKQAIEDGASEIDMVINIGLVKSGKMDEVLEDIKAVRSASEGYILKVIIETSQLTDEEKIRLCRIVSEAGADYIKTSTGFNGGGATPKDVKLLVDNVDKSVKVKASGGISTLEDAENYIEIGADRLGTSRIVKIVKQMSAEVSAILDTEY